MEIKAKKQITQSEAESQLGKFVVDALVGNFDEFKDWARHAPITMRMGAPVVAIAPGEADLQLNRAFQMLEILGVPRTRARYVCGGIDVYATRMTKELADHERVTAHLLNIVVEYANIPEGGSARQLLREIGKPELIRVDTKNAVGS